MALESSRIDDRHAGGSEIPREVTRPLERR